MRGTNTKVTLIGKRQAMIGAEFVFLGTSTECKNCKLRKTCMNLDAGRRYVITGLRNVQHECPVHESGATVVEVMEAPIVAAIDVKRALKGAKISFEMQKCDEKMCRAYDFCHPAGLQNGDKCTIVKVVSEMPEHDCKRSLKLAELKRSTS
ncbi:MAG: UPF0179 family protein [Methanosarcinales archaeon]|nr:MAG: UPF0179 family protein [Methanosarcinales archaeon]